MIDYIEKIVRAGQGQAKPYIPELLQLNEVKDIRDITQRDAEYFYKKFVSKEW